MSTAPFSRPQGDPAQVFEASRRLGAAATAGQGALSRFTAATAEALREWDTPIGVEFAQLCGGQAKRIRIAVEQVEGAAGALKLYGEALLAAQDEVDALTAHWLGEQATIEANPGPVGEAARTQSISRQGTIERDVDSAVSRLNSNGGRVAAMLDESTGALVPGGADKSPRQLYDQVMSAWTGLVPDYESWKEAGATAAKVVGTGNRITRAGIAVKSFAAMNRADTLAAQTKNLALTQAQVIIMDGGRYNRVPGQLGILARDIADARRAADNAGHVAKVRYDGFYRSVVPATRFAQGLAVVGIAGSAYDFFANPQDETGARRTVSMTMDVVGATAGSLALAASVGALTLGPVGLVVVGGALLVTAGWAVGTYVYDHWDDISQAASVASGWVADRASDVKDDVVDDMKDIAGGVKSIGSGIAHGVGGLFA